MTDETDFAIQPCGSCKGVATKRVLPVATDNGTILVGRCMVCDTNPCPKCKGRNIDPWATKCKHCNADIRLEAQAK